MTAPPLPELDPINEMMTLAWRASLAQDALLFAERINQLKLQIGPLSVEGCQPRIGFMRETGQKLDGTKLSAIELGFGINQHHESAFEFRSIQRRAAKDDWRQFIVLSRHRPNSDLQDVRGTVWLVNFRDFARGSSRFRGV